MGFDLHGKTLAIIGSGVIGRRVGKIARGSGMEVVAFDVNQDEQWAAANGIRCMSFKGLPFILKITKSNRNKSNGN